MKKILAFTILGAALLGLELLDCGCLLSKTANVTSSKGTNGLTVFSTNYVTTVNKASLAIWTGGASVATTTTVNAILAGTKDDPTVLADLKKAQEALNGVVNGANAASTQDVLNALKANGNPTLTSEITNLIDSVSQLEQQALISAGSTPVGEITLAFAKAVNSGLSVALKISPGQ